MRKNMCCILCLSLFFELLAPALCLPDDPLAQNNSQKHQIAVMDLIAKHGVEESLAKALSDVIRTEIHGFGDYEVISREDIQTVAKNDALQQALGCEGETMCLIDFGRKIGSRYLVAGTLSKFEKRYFIELRLIETSGNDTGVKERVGRECIGCSESDLIDEAKIVAAMVMGKQKISAQLQAEQKQKESKGFMAWAKRNKWWIALGVVAIAGTAAAASGGGGGGDEPGPAPKGQIAVGW